MKILKSNVCLGKLDNKNGQKMIEGGEEIIGRAYGCDSNFCLQKEQEERWCWGKEGDFYPHDDEDQVAVPL